jgi:hypothetical protein
VGPFDRQLTIRPERRIFCSFSSVDPRFARPDLRDRRDRHARGRLVERIQSEFQEMPGLRLTREQAMRLWSLPGDVCERLFSELERAGFLRRLSDGAYGRPDLGA